MHQPVRAATILSASIALAALAAGPGAAAQSTDHGKHLGQDKQASAQSTPSASPTATPSPTAAPSSSASAAPRAGAKKPQPAHPAHPTHPATGNGNSNGKAKGSGDAKGNSGGAASTGSGVTPGNNGTVKIARVGDTDRIPNNTPHPGCAFEVQWYGFDAGSDVVSTVTFSPQAPTKDVSIAVDGPTSVPVGEDAASGAGTATGLDAVQDYTLSFSGGAPAKQGYHVRLTVATPHSLGNDTKTKVFWVAPCDTATPTPTPTPAAPASAVAAPITTDTPAQGLVGDIGATPTAEEQTVSGPVHAPAVTSTTANGVAVPTAIEAGQDRHGVAAWVRSPLPLIAAGLGVLLALLGLARLRRRA